MEIKYYGANCIRITNKKVSICVDDNIDKLGLKSVTSKEDVSIFTAGKDSNNIIGRFLIDGPGEFDISDVSILGIPTRAHLDEDGKRATIYRINIHNFSVVVLGHIYPDMTDEQLEQLGSIDVLIIPVGGNGYTIDAHGALQLVKKIEPKIVIPTHYADKAIKYEVPQTELSLFIKEMGVTEEIEELDSLSVKESELGDKTKLVVLKRVV